MSINDIYALFPGLVLTCSDAIYAQQPVKTFFVSVLTLNKTAGAPKHTCLIFLFYNQFSYRNFLYLS